MSKSNESFKPKTLSDDQLRTLVGHDLASAVSLINMIRNDPEILKYIQDTIITRVRTEEENRKAQPEMEFNSNDPE